MYAPEGQDDVMALECPGPRDDVLVVRVDKGPVDVQDRGRRHGAKLPA